uniref:Dynein axonemal assembly factor 6 n=1 Tax=Cyprinus carpio carpio TaxID=630221 RepID=A0A8C1BJJ3_CYPCA
MEGLASVHDLQALSFVIKASLYILFISLFPLGSTAYVKKYSKNIWDEDEGTEEAHFDDLTDPRPQPEYEIVLKQSVGTEDLFLGFSRKDPSSMCCDSMLLRDIELVIISTLSIVDFHTINSPLFKLILSFKDLKLKIQQRDLAKRKRLEV